MHRQVWRTSVCLDKSKSCIEKQKRKAVWTSRRAECCDRYSLIQLSNGQHENNASFRLIRSGDLKSRRREIESHGAQPENLDSISCATCRIFHSTDNPILAFCSNGDFRCQIHLPDRFIATHRSLTQNMRVNPPLSNS